MMILVGWLGGWRGLVVVSMLLGTLAIGLHYGALFDGWRYDDGPHLRFVTTYSPWQYFFLPDVMLKQSWAHITPWNAFFYEMGLPFFGLNALGHYAHLLTVLWLVSVATFFLLRLWIRPLAALMGASLFLAMPATHAISKMLMTGHYAYGLLFSILSLFFFARAVREKSVWKSVFAALFFALACLCKELYVPLVGIFLLLPVNTVKQRLIYLSPVLVVAAVYAFVRMSVLGGVGGVAVHKALDIKFYLETLCDIVIYSLGGGGVLYLVIAYLVLISVISIYMHKRSINLPFLVGCLVVLLLPILIVPQFNWSDLSNYRLLFFVGWAISVWLAYMVSDNTLKSLSVVIVIVILSFSHQKLQNSQLLLEKQNDFLLENGADKALLPLNYTMVHYLSSFAQAKIAVGLGGSPEIIRTEDELLVAVSKPHSEIYQFNLNCSCMKEIAPKDLKVMVQKNSQGLDAGEDIQFSIEMRIVNKGPRKLFSWRFDGIEGDYLFGIKEYGRLELTKTGGTPFGFDTTGPDYPLLHVQLYIVVADGRVARSPVFVLDPSEDSVIDWSGKSVGRNVVVIDKS